MKLPSNLLGKNASADARAQASRNKAAGKPTQSTQTGSVDGTRQIEEDEDHVDTGSGSSATRSKATGAGQSFSASTSNPLGDRAHIINKDALDQKAQSGPGSLDPSSLQQPSVADARRWLAKRGVELLVPEGWRFMGLQHEGRGIAFNHSGSIEGHTAELATWRLADDTPHDKFLAPYLEEAEELTRLGRLSSHERVKVGDVDGVLLVGAGPDSKEGLLKADPEQLFLATDGTGRRTLSWRGVVERNGEKQLLIISFASPVESFFEARPAFDAMLQRARVVS